MFMTTETDFYYYLYKIQRQTNDKRSGSKVIILTFLNFKKQKTLYSFKPSHKTIQ